MRKSFSVLTRVALSILAGAAVGAACLLNGCKPSAEKLAAQEQRIAAEADQMIQKAQAFAAEGQASEAIQLLDKALATPKFARFKEHFFDLKLDTLLAQKNDTTAADSVLAAWRSDPALAQSAFAKLQTYYQQQNDPAAVQAWCQRLLALTPSVADDTKAQIVGWDLMAALSRRDPAAIQTAIDGVMATVKPEDAAALLENRLGALIADGQQALARPLIARIEGKRSASPLFAELTATLTLRCVLAAGTWDQFPTAFETCAARLPDEALLKLMRTAFSTLQKKNQKMLVEQASKHIVFSTTAKTGAADFAARVWVECGVSADKQVLPERLDALLAAKISPVQVGNLYDRYFYEMVDRLDIIKKLCVLGEKIIAACSDVNTVNNLKVKVLDGAFIVENYDLAIHMLEQGIPGKDKMWHDMSISKVKAHRAMAQKNPREAVNYFREFMNAWIDSKQEEEYAPTSGIAYSREWILGRNANRIADILDSIPDKAEADKARAEAKAYFKVAIEKAKADAEATRLITEETKNMGF